ncbi:hypothetical protein QNM97_16820 [Gordonia sp. L191]|uniref:hypothetical protein n=1 Tax=Gordonia sp. L191 TaxID=2982699 RepID=UPI0024BFD5E9|nr:hypothetical protein [Gordonia sp. L191]WHU45676.1 hypothetical protein QNM97_16820 [Gordonia sp. L191]
MATAVALTGCTTSGTPSGSPPSVTSAHSTGAPPTATTPTTVPLVPASDVDVQGFTAYNGKAQCRGTDRAEMYMRTAKSALVVCRSEINRLYYRGYRIADGASIELYEVYPQGTGYVAVNVADSARYVITGTGFQVIQNGAVVTEESAIGIGPQSWASAQTAAPTSTPAASAVVLGAAGSENETGYGTAQPSSISLGSCSNSIDQITWQGWGNDVAFGTGIGCSTTGPGSRYTLVASDIGMCNGVRAYRKLKIGSNTSPTDICR